jgi:hypothetical protein
MISRGPGIDMWNTSPFLHRKEGRGVDAADIMFASQIHTQKNSVPSESSTDAHDTSFQQPTQVPE